MATPSPILLRRSLASSCRAATRHSSSTQQQLPFPLRYSQLLRPAYTTLPSTNSIRRTLHTTPTQHHPPALQRTVQHKPRKPLAHNREEVPDQPPPTDFGRMDVLADVPMPATAVQACLDDGFALGGQGKREEGDAAGVRVGGGDGVVLVGGEAFCWRPWEARREDGDGGEKGKGRGRRLVNGKGQWEVGEEAFAVLGLVWPRPDLLILGLGPEIRPLSPATRRAITNLGMRVEILDTRNAASQYNMLATERGVDDVAAALIPIGWKEGAE